MKKILGRYGEQRGHWVGDGFPVRSLFSYVALGGHISPFLLLDYAAPYDFEPTINRRGVGQHPHRGFETVTIVYDGEVEHRDSTGGGGIVGPGGVQWMTAGGGILHEEFHSTNFAQNGGPLEMVQLWVNLPAKDKMVAPRYQSILCADIPVVELPDDAGALRVIAGRYKDVSGPARTFTPINLWDMRLERDAEVMLNLPEGHTTILAVLAGEVRVNGDQSATAATALLLDPDGDTVSVAADSDARMLVLTGEPIDEPIVGYGPFVMNTKDEIRQAISDFQGGGFGQNGGSSQRD